MLQALIDKSQENVSGTVRLKLYKGNTTVVGRKSPKSLYSMQHVTFEDDQGAYNQRDAEGFIKLNALRLRLRAPGAGRSRSGRHDSSGLPYIHAVFDVAAWLGLDDGRSG